MQWKSHWAIPTFIKEHSSPNAKQPCFTLSEMPSNVTILPRPEGKLSLPSNLVFYSLRRVKHSWRHGTFSLQAV